MLEAFIVKVADAFFIQEATPVIEWQRSVDRKTQLCPCGGLGTPKGHEIGMTPFFIEKLCNALQSLDCFRGKYAISGGNGGGHES